MSQKIKVKTLQQSSIMTKFSILFIVMSVLPIVVLYYFYYQFRTTGGIEIPENYFWVMMVLLTCGILIGYATMRRMLRNFIEITEANKKTLTEVLGQEKIQELTENNDEVALLARSFGEITSRLEENVRNLEISKKTLQSVLSRVGQGISSMQNIDSFLELIVETVTSALSAEVGVLLLIDGTSGKLYVKSVYGIEKDSSSLSNINFEESLFGSVLRTRKPLLIPKLEVPGSGNGPKSALEPPVICAPLVLHEELLGVLTVSGRKSGENFGQEEMELLYNLALQTAVAVENSKLNADAEKTYLETISALALAVEAKDHYSRGHLDRVSDFCMKIAGKLNLSEEDKQVLRDGARLHDLGKIGIVDEILKKPGPLSPSEWEIMRKHTEIGEGIIKPIRSLSRLCDIVRHHHEKLDGSGYPDGLKGDEISLLCRILSIADIFDALVTDRPYRKAFSVADAKQELIKMKGKLDPKLVDLFLETV